MIEINMDPESWDNFARQTDDKLTMFGDHLDIEGAYVRLRNTATGSGIIVHVVENVSGPMSPALNIWVYRVEFLIKRG